MMVQAKSLSFIENSFAFLDPKILNGSYIERRVKPIEEDIEFEITDTGEVEYTPSEGERTSQDYAMVAKSKQGTFFCPALLYKNN